MTQDRLTILFLGDRNEARSQIAEALMRSIGGAAVTSRSAGLEPGELPLELPSLLAERGLDLEGHSVKTVATLTEDSFDLVVTLTPRARRACSPEGRAEGSSEATLALFIGSPMRVHWQLVEPSTDEPREALRSLRDQLEEHVRDFVEQGYLEALSIERQRATKLIDAIDIGIVVHDERRRIYVFNNAAERLTGRRRADVLGRDCHEAFPPDGICGSRCAFRHGAAEPFNDREYQVAFTSADGTGRLVRMHSVPIEMHEGRPSEVVAQVSDVTEIDNLRWRLKQQTSLHGMVGESAAMRGVFEIIRQVATSDYPVLISGDSGTGKELAARAIHSESRRAEGPFVPINCGALPEHILESELFGHVRGAFTGAIRDKKGRFELADGGTIFLDEVGELTPSFQVKLLRVLQEMRFERVGGERTTQVDVRVISATNRDLRQLVNQREFREDLFYRLCVVPVTLPPLRERRGDIPLLVSHILTRIRQEMSRADLSISTAAMDLLLAHRWPGNVRELINALQFAAVRCGGREIAEEHLPPEVRQGQDPFTSPTLAADRSLGHEADDRRSRKKLEAALVEAALAQTGGNKVRAAKLLGVGRATLYRFLGEDRS